MPRLSRSEWIAMCSRSSLSCRPSQRLLASTSLLWPTGAAHMPFDQPHAYRGVEEVRVTTPGLYVFLCKLHPFMLGGVIVDDPATPELDLGKTLTLMNGATSKRRERRCRQRGTEGVG